MNVVDSDNETPLFTVESVEVAQILVENGATPDWRNSDGETVSFSQKLEQLEQLRATGCSWTFSSSQPADKIEEEFPDVADYLRSLSISPNTSQPPSNGTTSSTTTQPSQYTTEVAAELLTSDLISQVQTIMEQAEREGKDPEEDLQRVVGASMLASMRAGRTLGTGRTQDEDAPSTGTDADPAKRARLDLDEPQR